MGRPPKKGLDYSGWSVTIFDNDTKIDKLLDAHGWIGFGIYFYLCQRAYGGEGYFYQWGYDDCASTSRKMGGGISSGTVKETVGYCLQIGLFDKGLFDRWGVLTSRGIQRRYWEVVKERDVRSVISDYWLLQDSECKGLIKTPLNPTFPDENEDFPGGNKGFPGGNEDFHPIKESKGKERKEKEIKVKESKANTSCAEPAQPPPAPPVISFILNDKSFHDVFEYEIEDWKDLYPAVDIMQELKKMKGWLDSNPTRRKTRRGINRFINNWLARAQDGASSRTTPTYKSQTQQMLNDSYNMMNEWAERKRGEENIYDNG